MVQTLAQKPRHRPLGLIPRHMPQPSPDDQLLLQFALRRPAGYKRGADAAETKAGQRARSTDHEVPELEEEEESWI